MSDMLQSAATISPPLTTKVNGLDASTVTKRRPMIISQESADASPVPQIDFETNHHKLYAEDERSNSVVHEEQLKPAKVRTRFWESFSIGDLLEATEDDVTYADNARADEEEGIERIARSTLKLERLLWVGVCLCLDQILTCLTITPLRIAYRIVTLRRPLQNRFLLFDLACFSILVLAVLFLASFVGAAQVYHSIRLQTFMKLYVVVNIAEVLDRLLSSLGLDLFELLAESTATRRPLAFIIRYILCLLYTCLHAILFYVRLLTLSVAVNSSNDALFTILVSNNFVELKGSVFKRSTEQNLFQISCSDTVERFVLIVFMFLVGSNEYESSKAASERSDFFGLMVLVLIVEIFVDWIKHMFIVRFNADIKVRDVYDRFLHILSEDFQGRSNVRGKSQSANIFPPVSKRLGLPLIPIAALIARVVIFDVSDVFYERSWFFVLVGWCLSFVCKVLLKKVLSRWASTISSASVMSDDDKSPPVTPATSMETPQKIHLGRPAYGEVGLLAGSPVVSSVKKSPANGENSMKPNAPSSGKSSQKKSKTPHKLLSLVSRFDNNG